MSDLKTLALSYFELFSNKDLSGLRKMFTKDICLRDWVLNAEGINDVMKVNSKIFSSSDIINVIPINVWECTSEAVVIAELKIELDNDVTQLVTDVLEFRGGMVKSIRAYRGD